MNSDHDGRPWFERPDEGNEARPSDSTPGGPGSPEPWAYGAAPPPGGHRQAAGGPPDQETGEYWTAPGGGQPGQPGAPEGFSGPPAGGWLPPGPGGLPPAYPQAPPPKKRRTGLIVGLAVGGVVVVLGALVAVVGLSGDSKPVAAKSPPKAPGAKVSTSPAAALRSLRVPKSFGDYQRLSGDVADRVVASMRDGAAQGMGDSEAASAMKIGVYRSHRGPGVELFFIGLAANDSPKIAEELRSNSSSEEIDSMFLGTGITHTKKYPAGALGGLLRCGKGSLDGLKATVCGWADKSVAGLVMDTEVAKPSVLAGITRSLRGAAER